MSEKSFEAIILEALNTGETKTVPKEEADRFYGERFEKISPEIEKIRAEQRKAYEETRAIRLA